MLRRSHNAKVTLVYEHELPNVPGKSVKGVLVEYGPGGSSVAHTHPASAFIYATVLEGAIVSKVNDGPETVYRPARAGPSCPAIVSRQQECELDRAGAPPGGFCRRHRRDEPGAALLAPRARPVPVEGMEPMRSTKVFRGAPHSTFSSPPMDRRT